MSSDTGLIAGLKHPHQFNPFARIQPQEGSYLGSNSDLSFET
ncbi:hypothetical protein ACL9RJ_04895 [Pseudomonas sp. Mn2068]